MACFLNEKNFFELARKILKTVKLKLMLLPNFLNIMFIPLKPCTFLYTHNNRSICSLYTFVNCLFFYSFEIMLRITCKSEHKPEGVMNRFCQVNSLVVRRIAPNSQRMKSAAHCSRARSVRQQRPASVAAA